MKKTLALGVAIIFLISIAIFYIIISSSFSGIVKFFLSVILLAVTGTALQKFSGLEGEYGMLLLRTERGIKLLDKLAKISPRLWRTFADFGIVLGFGVSSVFIFDKVPKKTFVISLFILILISLFITPNILPVVLTIIQLPTSITSYALQQVSSSENGVSGLSIILVLIPIIFGGLSISVVIGLILNAVITLYGISLKILSIFGSTVGDAGALNRTTPGVAPIIPGINLPFFEGILSLIILLAVHEIAHGILARVEKIRVKSSGLVLFGFLPFGAFVDPDEEQLQKSSGETQSHVLIAGSTANLVASVVFFIILILFQYSIVKLNYSIYENEVEIIGVSPNSSAYGVLKEGMVIQYWNGEKVGNLEDLMNAVNKTKINETILVVTNKGEFNLKFNQSAVGIFAKQPAKRDIVGFLFNFLGLTFALNFLIGSVNLLPLPPFDGHRVVSVGVKDKRVMKIINVVIILSLILNVLPWLWR